VRIEVAVELLLEFVDESRALPLLLCEFLRESRALLLLLHQFLHKSRALLLLVCHLLKSGYCLLVDHLQLSDLVLEIDGVVQRVLELFLNSLQLVRLLQMTSVNLFALLHQALYL
jgi:hypothetical protein